MNISVEEIILLKNKFIIDKEKYYKFGRHRWYEINSELILKYICKHFKNVLEPYTFLYDLDFHNKRDPSHLICFSNGVYDLSISKFRNGRPSDYCTYCTNYEYKYTDDINFNKYITQVFPYNEDKKQFLSTLYNVFKGKKVLVDSRGIDCGIYTLYKLIAYMFGSYAITSNSIHKKNFKGKLITMFDKNIIFDFEIATFTTNTIYIDNEIIMNKLAFKSKFLDVKIEDTVNHIYKKDYNLFEKFPIFALSLMTKIINIEQLPLKIKYFNENLLLVPDVTNYILSIYEELSFI